ncbi:hypothetical protein O181_079356 [Austropuccinia psidii MF-1]|uniref:Uncharacterized protein n=1 Tax=Austropuccinia psidii MF-1 TaxID=1389203 RepID=A0A9Q3FG39_9BASI|nr:hypothetical protein [Austropuccinia psidii MF-1]
MICLVLALTLDLKMSSKLTSICDSDHSELPSVLYGAGVFDNLREFSEESMAPTEIGDINKTYNGLKSAIVIEPPCINCWKKGFLVLNMLLLGPPGANSVIMGKEIPLRPNIISKTIPEDYGGASRSVEDLGWKLLLMNLQLLIPPLATPIVMTGSRMRGVQQWTNTSSSWVNTGGPIHSQGNPIGVDPEVPILVTRKDGRLGKLKRNLVVQDENDMDAEGSNELDEEELV